MVYIGASKLVSKPISYFTGKFNGDNIILNVVNKSFLEDGVTSFASNLLAESMFVESDFGECFENAAKKAAMSIATSSIINLVDVSAVSYLTHMNLFTGEININKNMLEKSTKIFGEGDSQSKLYLQSTPHFFNVKKQFDKNTNNNYFKNKVDYIER